MIRKLGNRALLVVLASVGGVLLVVNFVMFFPPGEPERAAAEMIYMPRYGAWGDEAELELAELPSDDELRAQVNKLFAVDSIPVVRLTAEDDVTEDDVYKDMTMTVSDGKIAANNFEKLSGTMKPRGNSTYRTGLQYGAMPYKIKLDEAVDLLGMGESKKWCLIANFIDRSYVKQFIAYQAAQLMMGDDYFQPEAKYVEVYLNGTYKGLYLLTESIEEDEGRLGLEVDIEEYGDEVPFLLEMEGKHYICKDEYKEHIENNFSTSRFFADSWADSPSWLLDDDKGNDECVYTPYDLTYPDGFGEVSDRQLSYIRAEMYNLYADSKNGVPFDELRIDANSFVNYLVYVELFASTTYDGSSVFVYQKPDSDEMVMGPLWDFDCMMYVRTHGFWDLSRNTLFENLAKYRVFREAMVKRFAEYAERLMPLIRNAIDGLGKNQTLKKAVLRAEAKYHTWTRTLNGYNGYPAPTYDIPDETILSIKTFEGQVEHINDWLFDGFRSVDGNDFVGRMKWLEANAWKWGTQED